MFCKCIFMQMCFFYCGALEVYIEADAFIPPGPFEKNAPLVKCLYNEMRDKDRIDAFVRAKVSTAALTWGYHAMLPLTQYPDLGAPAAKRLKLGRDPGFFLLLDWKDDGLGGYCHLGLSFQIYTGFGGSGIDVMNDSNIEADLFRPSELWKFENDASETKGRVKLSELVPYLRFVIAHVCSDSRFNIEYDCFLFHGFLLRITGYKFEYFNEKLSDAVRPAVVTDKKVSWLADLTGKFAALKARESCVLVE